MRMYCQFSFFFQAEDGIRDGHVTGVQTCALPIFLTPILTDFGKYPFSAAHFLGHCFGPNSCARQLRGFCFHGSSRTSQFPPIKHPLALGAAASRFWVPQENGAKKGEKFMSYLSYLYVKRNSF